MSTLKFCHHCKSHLAPSEFYIDRSRADGLTAYCRTCKAAMHRDWFQANRDKRIQQIDRWKAENADAVRAANAAIKRTAYATDPEHREAIRQRNAEQYRRRKTAAGGNHVDSLK
jgi:hypothetical protein